MIRFIGDIHQKYDKYYEICNGYDYTIQVGDLGYLNFLTCKELDPEKHKFICGNHDNHDIDYKLPNCLGRFGVTTLNNIDIFFISGGYSLDWKFRVNLYKTTGEKTFFTQEQLNLVEQNECEKLWLKHKPKIVVSHEAPASIVHNFTNPEILKQFNLPQNFSSITQDFLQILYEQHQPDWWFFGHYHQNWCRKINGTKFVLLEEFGYFDLEL